MYVFPGIGMGTILSKATVVTQSMVYASATSLSTSLNESEKSNGLLYPKIERIREVSVEVAVGVIRAAQEAGVDRETRIKHMSDADLKRWVKSKMYDPCKENQLLEQEVADIASEGMRNSKKNGLTNGVTNGTMNGMTNELKNSHL